MVDGILVATIDDAHGHCSLLLRRFRSATTAQFPSLIDPISCPFECGRGRWRPAAARRGARLDQQRPAAAGQPRRGVASIGTPVRLRVAWDQQVLAGRTAAHGVAACFLVTIGERAIRRFAALPGRPARLANSPAPPAVGRGPRQRPQHGRGTHRGHRPASRQRAEAAFHSAASERRSTCSRSSCAPSARRRSRHGILRLVQPSIDVLARGASAT